MAQSYNTSARGQAGVSAVPLKGLPARAKPKLNLVPFSALLRGAVMEAAGNQAPIATSAVFLGEGEELGVLLQGEGREGARGRPRGSTCRPLRLRLWASPPAPTPPTASIRASQMQTAQIVPRCPTSCGGGGEACCRSCVERTICYGASVGSAGGRRGVRTAGHSCKCCVSGRVGVGAGRGGREGTQNAADL